LRDFANYNEGQRLDRPRLEGQKGAFAEKSRRVARRISFITCSEGPLFGPDFDIPILSHGR
jgi:hypothetical protein